MSTPTASAPHHHLALRLARLEAANRRMRRGLLLLVLAGLVLLIASPSHAKPEGADVLRVTRLELVDDEGELRGRLGVSKDGKAGLVIFGTDEQSTAAEVAVLASGTPTLALRNADGLAQAIVSVGESGPALLLLDREGKIGTSCTLKNEDGTSLLGMRLPGERGLRAVLSVMADGRPYLKLRGPDGELRIWGKPEIEFTESEGK